MNLTVFHQAEKDDGVEAQARLIAGIPLYASIASIRESMLPSQWDTLVNDVNNFCDNEGIPLDGRPYWCLADGIVKRPRLYIGNEMCEAECVFGDNGINIVAGRDIYSFFSLFKRNAIFEIIGSNVVGPNISTHGYCRDLQRSFLDDRGVYTIPQKPAVIFFDRLGSEGVIFIKDKEGRIISSQGDFWKAGRLYESTQFNKLIQFARTNLSNNLFVFMMGLNTFTVEDPLGTRDNFIRRFHYQFQHNLDAQTCHLVSRPFESPDFKNTWNVKYDPATHRVFTGDFPGNTVTGYVFIPGVFTKSENDTIFVIDEKNQKQMSVIRKQLEIMSIFSRS